MLLHILLTLAVAALLLAAVAGYVVYKVVDGFHEATTPESLFKNADLTQGRWAVIYTDDKENAKILDDAKILQKTGGTIHLYFDWQNFVPTGMPPPNFFLLILHDDQLFYANKVMRADKITLGDAGPHFVEAQSCHGILTKEQLPQVQAKLSAAEIYGTLPNAEDLRFDHRFTIYLPTRIYADGPEPGPYEGEGKAMSDAYEAKIKQNLAKWITAADAQTSVNSMITNTMGITDKDGYPVQAVTPGDPMPQLDRLVIINTSIDIKTSAAFYEKIRHMDIMTRLLGQDRGPDIDHLLKPRLQEMEKAHPESRKPFRADPQFYFRSKIEISALEDDPYYFDYYIKKTAGGVCPF